MKYLTIILTGFLKSDKVMGMDGIIYELRLWEPITLPKTNAEIFLAGGIAKLIDDHEVYTQQAMTR